MTRRTLQAEVEGAEAGDKAQIRELLAECGLPYEDVSPSDRQRFLLVRERTSAGSRLIGVIGLEMLGSSVGLLRSLAVSPSYRGRGLASQLVREAEEHARSCGLRELYLLTTTAEGFFARRGYRKVERHTVPAEIQKTPEFRSLCPESAVCMKKDLSESI